MNTKPKNFFDKNANQWDLKPLRLKLAEKAANSIIKTIPMNKKMQCLEIGCGTGLVTLKIQPFIESILAIDTSKEMMKILRKKIKTEKIANVKTKILNIEKRKKPLDGMFHLIYSSMTFHHLTDIEKAIKLLYSNLIKNGCLCIVDLDKEDGSFHDKNSQVMHFGFDKTWLKNILLNAGFQKVQRKKIFTIEKEIDQDVSKKPTQKKAFPVILTTGIK